MIEEAPTLYDLIKDWVAEKFPEMRVTVFGKKESKKVLAHYDLRGWGIMYVWRNAMFVPSGVPEIIDAGDPEFFEKIPLAVSCAINYIREKYGEDLEKPEPYVMYEPDLK